MTTPPHRVVVAQSVELTQGGLTGEGEATFIADLRTKPVLACALRPDFRLQSSATMGSNCRLAESLGTKASTRANACVGLTLPRRLRQCTT
jgi:hypothetical protein